MIFESFRKPPHTADNWRKAKANVEQKDILYHEAERGARDNWEKKAGLTPQVRLASMIEAQEKLAALEARGEKEAYALNEKYDRLLKQLYDFERNELGMHQNDASEE